MEEINFSYNWNNKLNCNAFTTFRMLNQKYRIGRIYKINLNRKFLFEAQIMDMRQILLEEITEIAAMIDTGLNRTSFIDLVKTMYKAYKINWETQPFQYMLLLKQKELTENKEQSLFLY